MPLFEPPTSFRLRTLGLSHLSPRDTGPIPASQQLSLSNTLTTLADHSAHPDFLHLSALVSEAVLEVVFVALPGFLAAWMGMFNAENQKFVAELNTMVFTPCLIFTKLASKLNAEQLGDLAVIPMIFVAQTVVSFLSSQLMARVFGFGKKNKKRQKNFIIAMGVFGNSNSLPISLVLSLSKTISGLHWDKVPGDNDDEVAARGILYLMIFQQLGQLLRWTWGYSVLLRPAGDYPEEERRGDDEGEVDGLGRVAEEGRYRDDPDEVLVEDSGTRKANGKPTDSGFGSSGSQTPTSSSSESTDEDLLIPTTPVDTRRINYSPRSSNNLEDNREHMTTFPNFSQSSTSKDFAADPNYAGWTAPFLHLWHRITQIWQNFTAAISRTSDNIYNSLPSPMQKVLSLLNYYNTKFWLGVWRQMNPPLWAMLAALLVASIPQLQALFFTSGTLVNNSITRAVAQSGGVAVPLILVVLGANLARGTLPQDQLASTPGEQREERKLLFASLISRMILPTVVMAPVLALIAKYVPVSILDDPIFIIVCFLLTGAPSALQLAQICQINEVFMGAMSRLLVASYVVAIFPSTLGLVLMALEVVEWAVL